MAAMASLDGVPRRATRPRGLCPLVIGEVVYMHVDPSCMTNGYIDMKKLNPIGRLNGFSYATLGKIFEREFFDGQAR
jgi:flavin reductase (DIM6/NTAB) family NADH-FMN oxidoreductase RutF